MVHVIGPFFVMSDFFLRRPTNQISNNSLHCLCACMWFTLIDSRTCMAVYSKSHISNVCLGDVFFPTIYLIDSCFLSIRLLIGSGLPVFKI